MVNEKYFSHAYFEFLLKNINGKECIERTTGFEMDCPIGARNTTQLEKNCETPLLLSRKEGGMGIYQN